MDTILLSIPYLVLSTSVNRLGEKEERIATPFGCVDIVFRMAPETEAERRPCEIQVGGDIDCWLVDPAVFNEFKATFLKLIEGILGRDIDYFLDQRRRLYVHFKGETLDITLPWQPAAENPSASQRDCVGLT